MKHILLNVFKGLLLAGAAAACILFYLYTIDFFAPPPSVGLLTSPSGKTYLDAHALKAALETEGVELLTAEPGESYAGAANRLLAAGAEVLIVPQDAAPVDSSLLDAAETAGATVFFVGESPSDATLNSSAELWYLGSLASHGGEVLGKAVAMDYRDGTIADANGDLLLQYYLFQSAPDEEQASLSNYALAECEHYGVYTAQVSYTDGDGAALPFDAESLAGQSAPEVILCTSAQDAQTALETASALGWMEGEQPVRIYAAADSPEEAEGLVAEGVQAVAHYDPAAMGSTAARMALNALEHQFPGLGTELSSDEAGRFILPYGLSE